MTNLIKEAIAWHARGYAPLPVAPDGTKRPGVSSWASYQVTRPTLAETIEIFKGDSDGIGLICGAVSGGLEMFELEGAAVAEGYVDRLVVAFADHDRSELWAKVTSGYGEATPGRGLHWYYRVADGAAARNTKLARRPATAAELAADPKNPLRVLIETRGEGGYTVVAPSAGRTHPTGLAWRAVVGDWDTVPVISVDDRDALYAIASTLDEVPAVEAPQRALTSVGGGIRPGDDFNARATWKEILEPEGWEVVAHFGGNLYGWKRPGKRTRGVSATSGRNDADNLYVFSTSSDLDPERPYSKFAVYAHYRHGGDFSAAARALRDQGYGESAPLTPAAASSVVSFPTSGSTALVVVESVDLGAVQRRGPTEDGAALAFVDLYGDRLRYCPDRRLWLAWNGARWAWDTAGQHREYVREMSRIVPETSDWRPFKKRMLTNAGVGAVVGLALSDERLTVGIDDLDARPYELNTPGGIVDLRTGKIRPADPKALHTRTTPTTPDFDRRSEIFEAFLATTFGSDPAMIAYVQRLFGLSVIGVVVEQILLFANGAGANGKTTLVEAVMGALGVGEIGYATAAPSTLLMVRKQEEHAAELATLAGARLVVCSELDEGQRFAEARVKLLTGRDSISARFMRGNPFTYTPSATLWLVGNHKPEAAAGGPAFWRRLRLVPFDHVVDVTARNPHLGEELATEAPAILAWLARGAADYSFGGLRTPGNVETATYAYASDQDTVGRFVDEQCHRAGRDVQVGVTVFRDAYEAWCRESGDTAATARRLTQELRDRYGISSEKQAKGRRFYVGVCLLNPADGAGGSWYDD